jgi:hypothetical protein
MVKKLIMSGLIFLLVLVSAYSQIPNEINYQGRLTDTTGIPINDTLTIQFKIYQDAVAYPGEIPLWTETQFDTLVDGLFSLLLGSIEPIPYDVFDGSLRYLGITLRADPEMTPRKALVSVGYAYRAYDADKLDGQDASSFLNSSNDFGRSGVTSDLYEATSTLSEKYVNEEQENSVSSTMISDGEVMEADIQTNAVTTTKIKTNAITKDKITPDFVSSVDGVKNDGGNIDLVGGNNITIEPDDNNNKITISASSSGDNLGNHTATQNIKLNGKWLSKNGGNEGIFVDTDGKVGINNNNPFTQFDVLGTALVVCGSTNIAVSGANNDAKNVGYLGGYNYGVEGTSYSGAAIRGLSSVGYAGYFNGKVYMDGNVGVGTETPNHMFVVAGTNTLGEGIANSHFPYSNGYAYVSGKIVVFRKENAAGNAETMRIANNGNVGIATTSPNYKLHVNGSAGKPGGGSWSNASDERLKNVKRNFNRSLEAIDELNPVYYTYKKNNEIDLPVNEEYVGLLAQEVQKVIPEAVGEYEKGYLSVNNDPIIWTMLNAIKELKAKNSFITKEMLKTKAELVKLKSKIYEQR